MEEEDEDPPLAVEINQVIEPGTSQPSDQSHQRHENVEASSVGVTVITGYLGAGKSTVSIAQSSYLSIILRLYRHR